MPVRLIALDIDGTLLDERSHLPASNRKAVAEAAARGIEIALVTGRRYDFATPIARQFPCPLTMIVNNGALVKSSSGETHYVNLLHRSIAARVLEEAELQAALQLRARLRGCELPDETARWLQRRFPRDIRSLYELLDTLDEAALAAQRRLTIPFIREVLRSAARTRGE